VLLIGTSGWQYRDWRPGFYDAELPQRLWLERYAEAFATVEVNNAFYRLPERSTFEGWRERTPDDFRFAVKMSRYLTHIKRLREPAEPVARFLDRATLRTTSARHGRRLRAGAAGRPSRHPHAVI
jgi:uncharacterized protein YecE (DUF72 family)